MIRDSLASYERTGSALLMPLFLTVLADACQRAGQAEEARTALAGAVHMARKTGERWWEPELLRALGELHRAAADDHDTGAESEARSFSKRSSSAGVSRPGAWSCEER